MNLQRLLESLIIFSIGLIISLGYLYLSHRPPVPGKTFMTSPYEIDKLRAELNTGGSVYLASNSTKTGIVLMMLEESFTLKNLTLPLILTIKPDNLLFKALKSHNPNFFRSYLTTYLRHPVECVNIAPRLSSIQIEITISSFYDGLRMLSELLKMEEIDRIRRVNRQL